MTLSVENVYHICIRIIPKLRIKEELLYINSIVKVNIDQQYIHISTLQYSKVRICICNTIIYVRVVPQLKKLIFSRKIYISYQLVYNIGSDISIEYPAVGFQAQRVSLSNSIFFSLSPTDSESYIHIFLTSQ